MSYKHDDKLDLVKINRDINEFFEKNDIFNKSIKNRHNCPEYTFYEGPPSANGLPGIHHVLSRTLKDLFCRYKTLNGYHVLRKSGWDTHGLPVELQVEKMLKITKDDIGKKISVQNYNKACKDSVDQYKDKWKELTFKLGYWIDLDNPYVTCDKDYIESLWWVFKQLFDKGLIYKGYSVQPYSPAAGTGLSSHELNQPGCYKMVKDLTVTVQFKINNTDNDYFLAWTTTPWTLPANSALAIGENIKYVKIKTINQYTQIPVNVILAEEALSRYFKDEDQYEVIGHYLGKDLLDMTYEQLYDFVKPSKPAFRVISGDYVTTEEGTGIVHIAPSFGADDMRVAKQFDIPEITVQRGQNNVPIVDLQGKYVDEIIPWAGEYVKSAYYNSESNESVDVKIVKDLKYRNRAFKSEKHEHHYPHCWRTDKPILYYPLQSWFIKTTDYKSQMIEINKSINWKPESTGTGRFGNWLENIVDWNISRNRFWGTPIPIWINDYETLCIGSYQELKDQVHKSVQLGLMKNELPDDFQVHKPYIDEIILSDSQGRALHRVPEVIDVWFDSGSMPYAQWHYPFENKELFDKKFPADFIAEGVDQTRGWFYTLHVLAVMLFNNKAYKNVISNGLVLDKNGNKMSKRLGNVINPFEILDQYGADALRWYVISNAQPWDNLEFNVDGIVDISKKLFSTLFNTYNFFALYANLDNYVYEPNIDKSSMCIIDKWLISKLNSVIKEVKELLDNYESTKATRLIQKFIVDDISNWYVRLNRKRYWKSDKKDIDKLHAYYCLYLCLYNISIISSPIAPFFSEYIFQRLLKNYPNENYNSSVSVHLCDYPPYNENDIDISLEEQMTNIQNIISTIHALRKKEKIKVRQPLSEVKIYSNDKSIMDFKDLILTETNIKNIEVINDQSIDIKYIIKPNLPVLGQKYKNKLKDIINLLNDLSTNDINQLVNKHTIILKNGENINYDDVLIEHDKVDGICMDTIRDITIILNTHITEDLKEEGIIRDIINGIQNLRKNKNFQVEDRINIKINCKDEFVLKSIKNYIDILKKEVLANNIEFTNDKENYDDVLDGKISCKIVKNEK